MHELLWAAIAVAAVLAVAIPTRRRQLSDWYALPRADRQEVGRAVREGRATTRPELRGHAQWRARSIIREFGTRRRPILINAGLTLLVAGAAGDDIYRHDWPALAVPAILLAMIIVGLYAWRRYPVTNARRALDLNT